MILLIVKYTEKELDLLARLMRAEALGEGNLGMLMVGNVGVNRVIANCLDFKNTRSITDMVYQSPGGFSGVNSAFNCFHCLSPSLHNRNRTRLCYLNVSQLQCIAYKIYKSCMCASLNSNSFNNFNKRS